MTKEGLSLEEARKRCWLVDVNGLIERQPPDLADFQKPFAHAIAADSFLAAVEAIRPTGIIGVSTVPKLFNQAVIEAMARINERPIIFPYSNPTSRSECTAEEAYKLVAGPRDLRQRQPLPASQFGGKTFVPGQATMSTFSPPLAWRSTPPRPGASPTYVPCAAKRGRASHPGQPGDGAHLTPAQSDILKVSLKVAVTVAGYVFDQGLAGVERPADIAAFIGAKAYSPRTLC